MCTPSVSFCLLDSIVPQNLIHILFLCPCVSTCLFSVFLCVCVLVLFSQYRWIICVGLEIVKQLVGAGAPVKALVRRPEAKTMLEEMKGVTAVLGDAKDEAAVQGCMRAAWQLSLH